MAGSFRTVFIAKDIDDVLFHVKSVGNIQILGGATLVDEIAEECLTTRSVQDLRKIEKHEMYMDFGPAVTLSEMLKYEHSHLPKVLSQAIHTIGNENVRNMATLGGNICATDFKHTLWAPLLALSANLEIKGLKKTKYIPFDSFDGLPPKTILTNIRIPLDEWDVEIFKRVGPSSKITSLSACFVFLVSIERNIITNFKLVFAGPVVFHSRELENRLIGTRLPLKQEFVDSFVKDSEHIYDTNFQNELISPVLKVEFLNLLKNSLEQLR